MAPGITQVAAVLLAAALLALVTISSISPGPSASLSAGRPLPGARPRWAALKRRRVNPASGVASGERGAPEGGPGRVTMRGSTAPARVVGEPRLLVCLDPAVKGLRSFKAQPLSNVNQETLGADSTPTASHAGGQRTELGGAMDFNEFNQRCINSCG